MGKQKHDYKTLKLEFFESDFDEVKGFVSDKWHRYNPERAKRTKWWAKEKQEWKEQIIEKALARKQDEMAKKLDIPMEWMLEAKKTTIELIKRKLKAINEGSLEDWNKIDLNDLEKVRKITKTELGEPTNVSYNENNNKETIQSISVVIWPQQINN